MRSAGLTVIFLLACVSLPAWSQRVEEVNPLNAMFERGDFTAAETELRRLLGIEEDPAVRDLLGVALIQQGRLAEAEVELRIAVKLEPGLQAAWQHLARLYLAQRQPSEALAALRTAADLGDLERKLAMSLAQIELEQGRPGPAKPN